eukprot:jgi/Mesen1/6399/ME000329S05572
MEKTRAPHPLLLPPLPSQSPADNPPPRHYPASASVERQRAMVAADDEWEASEIRNMRVAEIFKQFDCNCDGRLNRDEMAALVVAVNPRVKFNELQIAAILDEVFRTYGEFIEPATGLSLEGLRRTYDDGAGDVDRDFTALGLTLVHVNYGILVEEEGLLLAACEHYRAAAALNPQHFRALKLLGSALFGVGEARPAEEALARALALNGAYADARCELGSVLHALGEDTPAEAEFGRALELEPGHEAAQYNLAGLLRDSGQYARALQEYEKLLARAPGHWRARLNYAVAQMGAGFHEAAQASMRQVLRSQRRVEVYDALAQLDRLARTDRHLGAALEKGGGGGPHVPYVVARPDQLACATEATTPAAALATALEVRSFQHNASLVSSLLPLSSLLFVGVADIIATFDLAWDRRTRLGACPVMSLKAELVGGNAKVVPKSTMEALLRRLLPALTPEPFQAAVKALNERVLTVLDPQGASQVPLGPALAAMALLCAGGVAERCHVAYEALCWHSGGTPGQLARAEADAYLGSLSRMYLPSVSGTGPQGAGGFAAESGVVSHADFTALLLQELPVLETLSKLESCDRERHNGLHCCVCSCPVVGPRFRETRAHFSLCSFCYSERKVPAAVQRAEYQFREYTKSPVLLRDKFKVKAPPRGAQAAEEGVGAH